MWDWDRLHMSPSGHENMATRVLDVLGVEHGLTPPDLGPAPVLTKAETRREDRQWAREFLVPWVARRVKGTSSGDGSERQAAPAFSDSVLILALTGERDQVVDGLAFRCRWGARPPATI